MVMPHFQMVLQLVERNAFPLFLIQIVVKQFSRHHDARDMVNRVRMMDEAFNEEVL